MTQKPEDKEKEFEKWMKRLASEPLKPTEETEKKEQYLTKRQLDNMVDIEDVEKEYCQDEERRKQQKKDYRVTGRIDEISKSKYSR